MSWSSRDLRRFKHFYLFTESITNGAWPVGCLLSGIMMELWGRRRGVQIAVSSVCVGCLLIAVPSTYPLLLVGTAVCGFGIGASVPGIFVSKIQRNKGNIVKI